MILLAVISALAAFVNGALGYGFSSIAVPLALLIVSNRALNPTLVLLEVVLNAYMLWSNRGAVGRVWRRAAFVIVGLLPGLAVGTAVLAHVNPSTLKLATFVVLLPLVLAQAAGLRRAIRFERAGGVAFGGAVGVLYAVTTISGPPLATFLTNQGYTKNDFRAALALIRVAESLVAAMLYARSGLFTAESLSLVPIVLPGVLIGIPLGAYVIRHVDPDVFRRVCATFDAAIVAFGLSALLASLEIVEGPAAYLPLGGVLAYNVVVLHRFARGRRAGAAQNTAVLPP